MVTLGLAARLNSHGLILGNPWSLYGTDYMRVILLSLVMLLPACGQMGPLYLPEEADPALEAPEPPPEDDEIESEDDTFDAGPEAP